MLGRLSRAREKMRDSATRTLLLEVVATKGAGRNRELQVEKLQRTPGTLGRTVRARPSGYCRG